MTFEQFVMPENPSDRLGGFRIVESHLLVEQWRLPRSKKRRIRRKWAARKSNWKPDGKIYKMGDTIWCHPIVAARLRRQIDEN